MGDLVNAAAGGVRGLLVGWVLPVLVVLEAGAGVVWLVAREAWAASVTLAFTDLQLVLLIAGVTLGLVLSSVQVPLYRVLEGYLWPGRLRRHRIAVHRVRRLRMTEAIRDDTVAPTGRRRSLDAIRRLVGRPPTIGTPLPHRRTALEKQLLAARLRYPIRRSLVMATQLGNAVRRLEEYSTDRWNMDSITLFAHLVTVAPEPIRKAQEEARASVDFAVAMIPASATFALACTVVAVPSGHPVLLVVAAIAVAVAFAFYRVAVVATDEWTLTVCALVDLGRVPLAEALNLTLPDSIRYERYLWNQVGELVREGTADDGDVAGWLTYFSAGEDLAASRRTAALLRRRKALGGA